MVCFGGDCLAPNDEGRTVSSEALSKYHDVRAQVTDVTYFARVHLLSYVRYYSFLQQ